MLLPSDVDVLYLNPNVAGREARAREMAARGLRVVGAASLGEALERARRARFDVVFVDTPLEGNAAELFWRASRTQPYHPIVLQSSEGMCEPRSRVDGFRRGVDLFVPSDIDADELVTTMRALVRLRETEATLREREETLRLAMSAAKMATWDWDIASGRVVWSDNLAFGLGLAPDEFGGTIDAVRAHIFPPDLPRVAAALQRALAGEGEYDVEFRFQRPDGSLRWCRAQGTVVRDTRGQPVRMVGVDVDITARKEAEAALSEREERLRLAISAAKIGTWDWDLVSERIGWSEELASRLGLAPEAFDGTFAAFRALVYPEDLPRVEAALRRSLAGEEEYNIEFRLQRADGGLRWAHAQAAVVRDAGGKPVRMVGVDVDVTARKEAEAAQRLSDLRFRAIFDGTFECTSLLAPDGTVLEVNKAALAFHGATEAAVVGRPMWEVGLWAASVAAQDRLKQAIARAASGSFVRYEVEIVRQGAVVSLDFSLRPVRDGTGTVILLIPEARDISELRQADKALRESEERLRLAQEAAGIGIFDWDIPSGRVLWSAEQFRIFGADPDGSPDTYGRWRERVHPDDLERIEGEVRDALRTGAFESEYRIRRDGEVRWLLGRGTTLFDDDGTPWRMIGINIDITSQKQGQQALQLLKQMAEESVQAKTRMLTTTVHDLRQPLQMMYSTLDIVASRVKDDDARQRLRRALTVAERMSDALSKLLADSRLVGGAVLPRKRVFPLDRLLRRLEEDCAPLAHDKGLLLVVRPCGLSVISDPDMLLTMLANLAGNAVKYTQQGGVAVSAEARGATVILNVEDSGIGIPADLLDSIWDEYRQVTPGASPGVGLGLSIVKTCAGLLGHPIAVRSRLGQGSCFTIELPLDRGSPRMRVPEAGEGAAT